jgi:hypothetical protein
VTDDLDETMQRVVEALRPLPTVDDVAKARLLVAVAAERQREREAPLRRRVSTVRRWVVRGIGVAAAAVLAVVVLRSSRATERAADRGALTPSAAPSAAAVDAQFAAGDADKGTALQSVQLVLRAPAASRVRVVGDFNAWDGDHAQMTRDPVSGLWTTTLALRPGRHIYAFIVDDSTWMRDPRAPTATDADFGRPGSVLLVGRP